MIGNKKGRKTGGGRGEGWREEREGGREEGEKKGRRGVNIQ